MLTVCFEMYLSTLQSFTISFCTCLIADEVGRVTPGGMTKWVVLHVVECGTETRITLADGF